MRSSFLVFSSSLRQLLDALPWHLEDECSSLELWSRTFAPWGSIPNHSNILFVSLVGEHDAGAGDGGDTVPSHDVVLPVLHPLRQGCRQEMLRFVPRLKRSQLRQWCAWAREFLVKELEPVNTRDWRQCQFILVYKLFAYCKFTPNTHLGCASSRASNAPTATVLWHRSFEMDAINWIGVAVYVF